MLLTIPNGWSHLSNYPLKKLVLMHKFWYYKSPGWKKEPETLHWWSISPASCEAPGSNSTKRWQASSFHLAVLKTINFSTLRLWPAYWYVRLFWRQSKLTNFINVCRRQEGYSLFLWMNRLQFANLQRQKSATWVIPALPRGIGSLSGWLLKVAGELGPMEQLKECVDSTPLVSCAAWFSWVRAGSSWF